MSSPMVIFNISLSDWWHTRHTRCLAHVSYSRSWLILLLTLLVWWKRHLLEVRSARALRESRLLRWLILCLTTRSHLSRLILILLLIGPYAPAQIIAGKSWANGSWIFVPVLWICAARPVFFGCGVVWLKALCRLLSCVPWTLNVLLLISKFFSRFIFY